MLATLGLAITVFMASVGLVVGPPTVQRIEPASTPVITIDEARAAFVGAGFQIEETHSWDWTSPPVSTFGVQDPGGERRAMVLVYPTSGAAELARARGGALVVGYSASAWQVNVAIVQTSQQELDRVQRMRNDCDDGVLAANEDLMAESSLSTRRVDLDLQQALNTGARSL
jgi:hypothetical protein